jgi:hypothetical protein
MIYRPYYAISFFDKKKSSPQTAKMLLLEGEMPFLCAGERAIFACMLC